jgi:hypothetical protein
MKRAATLMFCLAAFAQGAVADGLKEGKWEFVVTMQMAGMPQMPQLPPGMQLPAGLKLGGGGMTHTYQHCMTKTEPVPKDNDNCKFSDVKQDGSTYSFKATCDTPNGGKADAEGSTTYTTDTTMTGTMHVKGSSSGHAFESTQTTTGKYLGPC